MCRRAWKLAYSGPFGPSEDAIDSYLRWFDGGFPGWEAVRLFLEMKMLTGRRLLDLSKLRSDLLVPKARTLTIHPHQDKTHRELNFPFPEDLEVRP